MREGGRDGGTEREGGGGRKCLKRIPGSEIKEHINDEVNTTYSRCPTFNGEVRGVRKGAEREGGRGGWEKS